MVVFQLIGMCVDIVNVLQELTLLMPLVVQQSSSNSFAVCSSVRPEVESTHRFSVGVVQQHSAIALLVSHVDAFGIDSIP